jgi:hypothetical protein
MQVAPFRHGTTSHGSYTVGLVVGLVVGCEVAGLAVGLAVGSEVAGLAVGLFVGLDEGVVVG